MNLFLNRRQPELVEEMEQPDCDPIKLNNTYNQFYRINTLLSRWRVIYKNYLRPLMTDSARSYTLLDIGFGGGDIVVSLSQWASRDGIDLRITAIEQDERAMDFIRQRDTPSNIRFRKVSSSELVKDGEEFDFVISNHLLHHIDTESFRLLLDDASRLARQKVIFNDIERSAIGYLLFTTLSRPLFWNSFITPDGLISIRRSYTFQELTMLRPQGWKVERLFPFRLLLIYSGHEHS